jgi:hypothetical protein
VEFDWPVGADQPLRLAREEALPINPVRESMRLATRNLTRDQLLDLRLKHPRPVYFDPPAGQADGWRTSPVFMMSHKSGWNESNPFPTERRVPQPPSLKDEDKEATGALADSRDRPRMGMFPIGVAVEARIPAAWRSTVGGEQAQAVASTVRVAAIGHGGVFVGDPLTPPQEKLFLDLTNWLLGRDDLLARENVVWKYPRVHLSPEGRKFWEWGARLGLPALFAYVGMIVMLVRRMR